METRQEAAIKYFDDCTIPTEPIVTIALYFKRAVIRDGLNREGGGRAGQKILSPSLVHEETPNNVQSLFYLTNIFCHFPLVFPHACGRWLSGCDLNDK
jgi:hypothetical protein